VACGSASWATRGSIVVVDADDRQSLEYAIIENVQRSDLNALEEAIGYEKLTQEFSYNQADVAKIIGKSRSHVTNTLRLLKLPEGAKKFVIDGSISADMLAHFYRFRILKRSLSRS